MIAAPATRPAAGTGGREWAEGEFETLFRQHYARIVEVVRRLAADRGEAEVLASEAFWRLYRARPRERGNLAGWLYRAAVRAGLDAQRAGRRRRHYEAQAQADRARREEAATPLAQLETALQAGRVRATLGRLRRRDAAMLALRYTGASYREMAAATGVRVSSVGTLLARAEAAFGKEFGRETKGEER